MSTALALPTGFLLGMAFWLFVAAFLADRQLSSSLRKAALASLVLGAVIGAGSYLGGAW
jgi:hypothetical protein